MIFIFFIFFIRSFVSSQIVDSAFSFSPFDCSIYILLVFNFGVFVCARAYFSCFSYFYLNFHTDISIASCRFVFLSGDSSACVVVVVSFFFFSHTCGVYTQQKKKKKVLFSSGDSCWWCFPILNFSWVCVVFCFSKISLVQIKHSVYQHLVETKYARAHTHRRSRFKSWIVWINYIFISVAELKEMHKNMQNW